MTIYARDKVIAAAKESGAYISGPVPRWIEAFYAIAHKDGHASRDADRDNLTAALQFAVNMLTDGSEFFACLPDEITYAAEKELREFFRLVDITNTEPTKEIPE